MTLNYINKEFEEMIKSGAGVDEAIQFLHESEISIVQSIIMIKEGFGLPLNESKEFVASHPCWKTMVEANQELHDELINLINKQK
jgi:hypothetical protein